MQFFCWILRAWVLGRKSLHHSWMANRYTVFICCCWFWSCFFFMLSSTNTAVWLVSHYLRASRCQKGDNIYFSKGRTRPFPHFFLTCASYVLIHFWVCMWALLTKGSIHAILVDFQIFLHLKQSPGIQGKKKRWFLEGDQGLNQQ